MLAGAFAEEIVHVLKFIILSVVKLDGAYEFDEFKFFAYSTIVIFWLNFQVGAVVEEGAYSSAIWNGGHQIIGGSPKIAQERKLKSPYPSCS